MWQALQKAARVGLAALAVLSCFAPSGGARRDPDAITPPCCSGSLLRKLPSAFRFAQGLGCLEQVEAGNVVLDAVSLGGFFRDLLWPGEL